MQPIAPVEWTKADRDLFARIEAHPFARPGQALDFTGRLGREMGWSRAWATRAIDEYRRFCFLALRGDGPVTPSEEVDAVWHLHLTYSRDYWAVWCGQVLGAALHHDPTAGGEAEQRRFTEQYARTLAHYESYFGAPDPAFWPGTQARFKARYRIVDTDRFRVLPRLRRGLLRQGAAILVALAVASIPEPAAALSANPLDWNGPDFLLLYAGLTVAALVLGHIGLRRLDQPTYPPSGAAPERLDLVDLAYLAGGPRRVADLALLMLIARGGARVEAAGDRIVPTPAGAALPPEFAPFRACASGPTRRRDFVHRVTGCLAAPRARLVARGLARDRGGRLQAGVLPLLPLLLTLVFGLAKVGVGLSRDRPIGFLVVMILVAAGGGWFLIATHPPAWASRAGLGAMAAYRRLHARAARAPRESELPHAFALGGSAVLAGTAYASYRAALDPPRADSGSSSGCSGGGDSGGGDSGGGGGCGGCGGGGD